MEVMAASATAEEIRDIFQGEEHIFEVLDIANTGKQFVERGVIYHVLEVNGRGTLRTIRELEQRLFAYRYKFMWL